MELLSSFFYIKRGIYINKIVKMATCNGWTRRIEEDKMGNNAMCMLF